MNVLRFIFDYKQDRVSMADQYVVDLGHPVFDSTDTPGVHAVARDETGNSLFQVLARGLFATHLESYTSNVKRWVPHPYDHGTIMVNIPYDPSMTEVAIVRYHEDLSKTDIAVFPITAKPES